MELLLPSGVELPGKTRVVKRYITVKTGNMACQTPGGGRWIYILLFFPTTKYSMSRQKCYSMNWYILSITAFICAEKCRMIFL